MACGINRKTTSGSDQPHPQPSPLPASTINRTAPATGTDIPAAIPVAEIADETKTPKSRRTGKQVRWWETRKLVIEFIRRRPATIQEIADKFFGGNYKRAAYCLKRCRDMRKLYHTTMRLKEYGRPVDLYSA